MAPFTGFCLAAPAGRGAVRPAPAASRSPRALWPRPSPGCSSCSALLPGARALGAVWHADGEVRPWGPVCRGASVPDACVRARAHACVPCTHGHVCSRARAPVLPSTRGASLHAAPSWPRGPRCRSPGCPRLPWEPCSSLPSMASPTPAFCTDPFPHRRLPSVPLHPVWVTPPSSPVWAPSLSSDLTAHSRPPPPSTWSRGQPAQPRLMALGLFQ